MGDSTRGLSAINPFYDGPIADISLVLMKYVFFSLKVLQVSFLHFWQVENDLRFSEESYRKLSLDESYSATVMAKSVTRIAFLGVSSLEVKVIFVFNSDPSNIAISKSMYFA